MIRIVGKRNRPFGKGKELYSKINRILLNERRISSAGLLVNAQGIHDEEFDVHAVLGDENRNWSVSPSAST
jgi:hypothetical protein